MLVKLLQQYRYLTYASDAFPLIFTPMNNYEIIRELGSGSFGTAHLVKSNINNEYYVIK